MARVVVNVVCPRLLTSALAEAGAAVEVSAMVIVAFSLARTTV